MLEKEYIDSFFADDDVIKLRTYGKETNPFGICPLTEVQVSKFFAWLLNPREGHALGDLAVKKLLRSIWRASDEVGRQGLVDPLALDNLQCMNGLYLTEYICDEKDRLDLLVIFPKDKILIAIENKYGARQSDGQLKKYRKHLDAEFSDFKRFYVFVDFEKNKPNDELWVGLGYDWAIQSLEYGIQSPHLSNDLKLVFKQFLVVLNDDYDCFDVELCRVVASEHKEVISYMSDFSMKKANFNALDVIGVEYLKNKDVWNRVIGCRRFASVLLAMRDKFKDDCKVDEKRTRIYFTLSNWLFAQKTGKKIWFAYILFTKQGDGKYLVEATLETNSVSDKYLHALLEVMSDEVQSGRKRNLSGQNCITHFKGVFGAEAEAIDCLIKVVEQMNKLINKVKINN